MNETQKRMPSEVLRQLISFAFDTCSEDCDITLGECLLLFRDMAVAKSAAGNVPLGAELPAPAPAAAAEAEAPPSPDAPGFTGQRASEKRDIYYRLLAFCKRQGPGAAVKLAKASNGVLTDDDVREMKNAGRYEIAKWRVLSAAMDYIEGGNGGTE